MSSKARKLSKTKLGGGLHYPVEMYNTTVGSIVICGIMFHKGEEIDKKQLRAKWKKYKTSKEDLFDIRDPHLIERVLEWFGLEKPKYFPIAMVVSPYNILFAPYDKKIRRVLPLREDCFIGPTLKYGKVYPIEWDGVVRNRIWLKDKLKTIFHWRKKEDVTLQSK